MVELKIDNVSKKIKKNPVLSEICAVFEGGKIYGLKGKNGCGKTMLMRIICGLIIPDEGTVTINNEILHKDIEFPRSIGALIENPAFLPSYSGFDNLRLLASLQKDIGDEDIVSALEAVGLNHLDKRVYRKYSLGMKQKLGIANAIMGDPELIILDEPINALDEESVEKVKEKLVKLKDSGRLIIIACHDKEELEYLSDEIIEMKDGRIIGRRVL
jgi:ABC-2 type transport system ATP-binding protein